jgi:peptidoglycan hydrolase CwlO-like protein
MEDVESDQFARFEKTIEQLEKNVEQLEKDLERKDHTLEIMRDEIRELEKYLADQKEKNAFLELDISHLKDIIKRLVEHL